MAIAFGRDLGTGAINSSGTTVVITTSATATVGEWIIVRVATDNLSATTPTFTCADSAGNTYTVDIQTARNASAGAGIAGGVFSAPVTTQLTSGGTITVTLSGATFAKASVAQAFTGVGGRRASGTISANGASTAPTVTLTTPVSGDLVIGHIAHESYTVPSAYDTDTSNGSWSTGAFHPSATTGTDNQRAMVVYQYKIVTGTGSQTYNATVTNADWIAFESAYTPSAAGPNQGSSTGSVTWDGTAQGTSVHSGAATGTVTWAGTAQGTSVHSGSASGTVSWAGTADGIAPLLVMDGTASGTVTWAGTAQGTSVHSGSASGTVTWAGTAQGTSVHRGAATGTVSWAGTAQGTSVHSGSASGTVSWAGTAQGVAPAPGIQEGSATGTVTWAGTAQGTSVHSGSASGTVTWDGTADGFTVTTGSSTGTVTWAGTATGGAPSEGTILGEAAAVYLGASPVDRVYAGASLAWPQGV